MSHGDVYAEETEDILEAFRVLDKYGNGKISVSDFRRCMTTMGDRMTVDEVDEIIKYAKSDGFIEYEGKQVKDGLGVKLSGRVGGGKQSKYSFLKKKNMVFNERIPKTQGNALRFTCKIFRSTMDISYPFNVELFRLILQTVTIIIKISTEILNNLFSHLISIIHN